MMKRIRRAELMSVVAFVALAASLVFVGVAVIIDGRSRPVEMGEALPTKNHLTSNVFPYERDAAEVRLLGPSGEPRPDTPPVPGWMHSEMVYVSEVQESGDLRDAYTPNELLTFGIVTCRGDVDLVRSELPSEDIKTINRSAQKYLCVFYR